MPNGRRTPRDDDGRDDRDDHYWHRDRFGMHWEDRSTRWDRDEGYRPTEHHRRGYGADRYEEDRAGGRNTSYPGGFEDRPVERGFDPNEARGGYLAQGGQQMGYARSYEPHGTHRYGEHGYTGFPSQRGKGPVGYTRSDERIRELVCDALTDDHYVDATHIEVTVRNGEVILAGTVEDRVQKRMAESCVDHIGGVKDVQNQLRIRA